MLKESFKSGFVDGKRPNKSQDLGAVDVGVVGGLSGADICFSRDGHIVLKSLNQGEQATLDQLLERYVPHIEDHGLNCNLTHFLAM